MIDKVQNEVKSIADGKTPEVFALSFIIFKRRKLLGYKSYYHENKTDNQLIKGNCDCEYCRNLRLYVATKLEHHKEKKKLYNDDFILSDREISELQETLEDLKKEYKQYKKRKDQTKNYLKL